MAKCGVYEGDPTAMAKATELKRDLQKLVRAISQDEEFSVETIEQMEETLSALKEIKTRKKKRSESKAVSLQNSDTTSCPDEFRCPISNELMRDPVVLASGQTYDRPFIQKWLSSGNRTCPKTQQVLSQTSLTPNTLIQELISRWCKNQGMEPPLNHSLIHNHHIDGQEFITRSDRENFHSLLSKISSSSSSDQKSAAKEIRLLTKRAPEFRALFAEFPEAIPKLISPLNGSHLTDDCQLREDLITALLNISILDSNKKTVCETPKVIPLLLDSLRSGTLATRSNAAAAIFTLSALDSNKDLIGKSGALKPLVDLLEEGNHLAVKDSASAIFNLCRVHENRARAVRDGAVRVIVKKIVDDSFVDELLAILAILASHHRAVEEMCELGAVSCLLRIIRESSCERNKENAVAILHTVCFSDRTKWKEIREEENSKGTISRLARDGTSRARRKANGILDRLRRAVNLTHTA